MSEVRIFGGKGEHRGAAERAQRLAEIAGGEQAIVAVVAAEEKDVHVAMKLAMLEAVVEEMDGSVR
jgi:hypothetical protein